MQKNRQALRQVETQVDEELGGGGEAAMQTDGQSKQKADAIAASEYFS
jgi:hypothetical protein